MRRCTLNGTVSRFDARMLDECLDGACGGGWDDCLRMRSNLTWDAYLTSATAQTLLDASGVMDTRPAWAASPLLLMTGSIAAAGRCFVTPVWENYGGAAKIRAIFEPRGGACRARPPLRICAPARIRA